MTRISGFRAAKTSNVTAEVAHNLFEGVQPRRDGIFEMTWWRHSAPSEHEETAGSIDLPSDCRDVEIVHRPDGVRQLPQVRRLRCASCPWIDEDHAPRAPRALKADAAA